ncbi:DUF3367 domain-containing protein [Spiractinospora alimapuensis]|uniref:alpha-(1->3)-arabinofuranosyltransferase n=1 Tax=Spiractinospora alimapuensis TaxID=2820884 RepID=UPI0022AAF33F|nr:alpha-(1->3)-arabinofuranosyltransferase [Spiractinospora alimapuensis]QVQ54298.1 DUF3367 domain-containing protein [Spiractinospora alimapuensis]
MTHASSPTPRARGEETLTRRLTLFAVCLFLTALAFSVDPGRILGDTKIDLAINPTGFLQRALHLWDGAYFGQLQNQAYGYLFPNGPFHALLLAADMPPWMVQRVWMAVLLCAAFLGVVCVARALGIGTTSTQIVAGVAYALSPRVLTLLSYNSAELQPTMLLPWVLLPLIHGTRHGASPARAAFLSATAFLLCGGTNAASELAILVVPLLYLLTRRNGARTWRLLGWWLFAIALVTFWYLAPLIILGRYVYDFMPFTEDAGTTTSVASLINAVRGSSNWMGYLSTQGQAPLPAGAELANAPLLIAVTAVVAGLGLAGLANRRLPERAFLIVTLLTGVAIVVSGHTGDLTGPLAETMRGLYDGALAPFRNVHKFDAVIRLPLALGLAFLPLAVVQRTQGRPSRLTRNAPPDVVRRATAVTCAAAVAVTLTPIATAGIATRGGFEDIPDHWRDAIAYLDAETGDGMTMAVPGSARGEYMWGRPLDEPMQPLMDGRWTNHQIIPWGSPGSSRILHEVDRRLASGQGSTGLAPFLARMGVSHLLVRNDLQRDGANGAWPAQVHQALEDSPGISRDRGFGPIIGDAETDPDVGRFEQPYRAVDIYTVADPAPLVGTLPREDTLRVLGAPESLLPLLETGVLDDERPVVIGSDPGAEQVDAADTIATDTVRRREMVYPDVRRNVSGTLTADEEYERDVPAPDITDPAWDPSTATVSYDGIAGIRASSSQAGAEGGATTRDPGRAPAAAVDGNAATAWRSSGFRGAVGEWLEVELEEPRDVSGLSVAFEPIPGEPPPAELEVITDAGRVRATVDANDDAGTQEIATPPGETERVRIRVTDLAWEPEFRFGSRVGVTELNIPGVDPVRTLDVPGVDEAGTAVFTGSTGTVSGCMRGSATWVCAPELAVHGEDARLVHRSFTASADTADTPQEVAGEVVVTNPRTLENIANRAADAPAVTSSSVAADHPAALGRNALDSDAGTIWYPDPQDPEPTLDVAFGEPTNLDGILFSFPRADSVESPIRVVVETPDTSREAWLDSNGLVGFGELTTEELRLRFTPPANQPLELASVVFPGSGAADPMDELSGGVSHACGNGPVVRVNGQRVATRLPDADAAEVLAGLPVRFEACDEVTLDEGDNALSVDGGTSYRIEATTLTPSGGGPDGADDPVVMEPVAEVLEWGPRTRRLAVDTEEESHLVVNENHNAGWEATLTTADGARVDLDGYRLDGWRQAWAIPEGTSGTVTLTYAPDQPYRWSLAIGGVLAGLAALFALVPRRAHAQVVRGGRALPTAPAGGMPTALLTVLALLFGTWIAGPAGALVFGGALALSWWLSRRRTTATTAGPTTRPSLLLRLARAVSGPGVAVGALLLAGCALALGGHLHQNLSFHAVTALLADPLRGWIPQLLCLPALARLVVSLWRFEDGDDR